MRWGATRISTSRGRELRQGDVKAARRVPELGTDRPETPEPLPESPTFPYLENVHCPHPWGRHTMAETERQKK